MGSGFKTFATNSVLTAADVQGYLQDQSVMSFASAAARTSAVVSPAEGMVSYLRDVDTVEIWNGTAWKTIAGVGAGSILQTVTSSYTTGVTTASTSYVSTGSTVTITPKKSTSNILLIATNPFLIYGTGASQQFTIFRGTVSGTNLGGNTGNGFGNFYYYNGYDYRGTFAATVLDSPATTSATTYTVAFKVNPAGSGGWANYEHKSTITAMEVSA